MENLINLTCNGDTSPQQPFPDRMLPEKTLSFSLSHSGFY